MCKMIVSMDLELSLDVFKKFLILENLCKIRVWVGFNFEVIDYILRVMYLMIMLVNFCWVEEFYICYVIIIVIF